MPMMLSVKAVKVRRFDGSRVRRFKGSTVRRFEGSTEWFEVHGSEFYTRSSAVLIRGVRQADAPRSRNVTGAIPRVDFRQRVSDATDHAWRLEPRNRCRHELSDSQRGAEGYERRSRSRPQRPRRNQ